MVCPIILPSGDILCLNILRSDGIILNLDRLKIVLFVSEFGKHLCLVQINISSFNFNFSLCKIKLF